MDPVDLPQIFNSGMTPRRCVLAVAAVGARPIGELVDSSPAGHREVPGGAHWADLSDHQQADLLDDYRLAYTSHAPVNWAPGLGTVLAKREVTSEGRPSAGTGLQEGPAPVDAHHRVCRPAG